MRLEDVCEIVRGSSPRPQGDPKYYGGKVPRLMVADLSRDGMYVTPKIDFLTEEGAKKSRPMKKGDVVIAVSGDPGRPAILASDACIHDGFVGLRNLDIQRLDKSFLVRYLFFYKNSNKSKAVGAIFKNLTTDQIKEIYVPDLTLEEQRGIIARLDQADALRQKDRQLLALYNELTQSVFLEMFGDSNVNSKDWKNVRFEEIASSVKGSMRTGPFGSDLLHSEFVDEGVFVLGIDNVVNNRFEWAESRFITDTKYEKLKRYTVYPGDVLISIMGTTGRTAVVPNNIPKAINSKHLAAITLNKQLANPVFISTSIHSNPEIVSQLSSRNRGAIMDGLNLGIIKDLTFKLPPLPLQQRFAEIVAQIEGQKALVQQQIAQSEALFQRLLKDSFGH